MNKPYSPIGIFDSGLGGLSLVKSVKKLLPNEQLIYFADTAHLPFGDKSNHAIQGFSRQICQLLLDYNCKAILIACNSASSVAFDSLKSMVKNKIDIIDVINPTVKYIAKTYSNSNIGLIGTRLTVKSNVYQQKLQALNPSIKLKAFATPLFVPIIEEGFIQTPVSQFTISHYLTNSIFHDIQAFILACTHYPLLESEINTFFQSKVKIIDSLTLVVEALKTTLKKKGLLKEKADNQKDIYLASDITEVFQKQSKIFFSESINFHLKKL